MPSTATDRLSGLTTSVAVKAPVHAVSTANLALSGLQTVGGVVLNGDTIKRVLARNQTDLTENGIYDASTGDWTRAKDFDGNRDVVNGTLVVAPSSGAIFFYKVIATNPITIGTTEITFEPVTVEDDASIEVQYEAAGSAALNLHEYVEDDGFYSAMGFIPQNLKSAIRDGSSTADLDEYLQDGLDAAEAEKAGGLRLRGGRHNFTNTLTVGSNTQFVGAGMGFGSYTSTILEYLGSGRAIQVDGFYSRLADFTLWNAATGEHGIYLNATQCMVERVTVMPKNTFPGFSGGGIKVDTVATTFTHLLRRVYCWGNVYGMDVSRGNNIVIDGCFLESNRINLLVGNTSAVSNLVVCGGSVLELFGDGRGEETDTSVCIDIIDCAGFVCRDSYFEVNGASGATASTQRAIKLRTVRGGDIRSNYFYGGSNISLAATAAIDIASSLAKGVSIDGNEFASFNTVGVTSSGSGSVWQTHIGINNASNNTPRVYEDRWTPVLYIGGAVASGAAYAANGQVGRAQRAGNRLQASAYMELTSKSTSTGTVAMGGLPINSANVTNQQTVGSLAVDGAGSGTVSGSLHSLLPADSAVLGLAYNSTGVRTNITTSDIGNTSKFWVNIDYPLSSTST
jgi:hypothetical protein